ncbi:MULTISPECIES: hypothetical protein [unclassified Planococcus (in: firmicutes)]|uniref:hypothetical protein n=1 Tax=unclassified Planococcus (in: firmicutes) TaxID=2662419 RepID=UPI000C34BD0F|nr:MULTISPECIES: hypothetical protein [unclassified Planococcus (in: firmicutes)]AUD14905.1 hypothetical protein CW734_16060 [Planococcus sp. MB-3u-03]PKG45228.1 hypothetical protein CXF66_15595 [Planococcus sp. Urea-trap-24]PKG87570.1 hypothetical protein CXF91_16445 [Planococcus sp. Urea-3u-39]PKH41561.1 hypothetical protein CXF77_05965 [Planococcus sp. MB-3u-09]
MAKIPVKLVADLAIKHGPKVVDQIAKNSHLIKPAVDKIDQFAKRQNKRKDEKVASRSTPYLEQQYKLYNDEILPNLDTCQRNELVSYKLDVQKTLFQMNPDKKSGPKPKVVLSNKKSKKWEQVLSQIEGKLSAKDYEEYLNLYHNPESESVYFQGYEQNTTIFKKLLAENDSGKIREFLSNQTNMDTQDINRDFFLEFS